MLRKRPEAKDHTGTVHKPSRLLGSCRYMVGMVHSGPEPGCLPTQASSADEDVILDME